MIRTRKLLNDLHETFLVLPKHFNLLGRSARSPRYWAILDAATPCVVFAAEKAHFCVALSMFGDVMEIHRRSGRTI
jgi:hypothetical protein